MRLELRLAWLVALAIQPLGSVVRAQTAQEPFTVGDIRVEGLQRISEGTVFNYLPVNIGDHLDGQRIGEATQPIDVVLIHPEIGVALVTEAPRDPSPGLAALRAYLATLAPVSNQAPPT